MIDSILLSDVGAATASVFCDIVASHATKESAIMSEENLRLQGIYDKMKTFRLHHERKEIAVLDLSTASFAENEGVPPGKDELYLDFQLEDKPEMRIQLDKSTSFSFELGGVEGFPHPFYCHPRLSYSEDDDGVVDTVTLNVNVTDDVVLKATLSGFQGSSEDVKDTIDNNYYRDYFLRLGFPLPFGGDGHVPLLGSVCHFHTVAIRKAALQKILSLLGNPLTLGRKQQNILNEMKNLSVAYPDHVNIREAANRYKDSAETNHQFQAARELYQTVQGVGDVGTIFQLRLEHGTSGAMCLSQTPEHEAAWQIEPPEDQATMPLSSLAGFEARLGTATIFDETDIVRAGLRIHPTRGGFVLKYEGVYSAEAIFVFDESAEQFLETEEDREQFLNRVNRTLYSDQSNITHNHAKLEGMTVKLILLNIGMNSLKDRLEELGIDTATVDEGQEGPAGEAGGVEDADED